MHRKLSGQQINVGFTTRSGMVEFLEKGKPDVEYVGIPNAKLYRLANGSDHAARFLRLACIAEFEGILLNSRQCKSD